VDFSEVLDARRSIRKFYPKPVEIEKIGILISAGLRAPSVGDLQPWKFIVVTKANQLQAIADSCPYERWLYQAPLVIVVCSEQQKTEAFYPGKGGLWASHSCAAAAENILLTAVELGLAGCWVGSFETEKIKEVLHIPSGIEPDILLAVGYPDEEPSAKKIAPFDTKVYFNDFGATNVDVALYRKDYGLFFRKKADDIKTRIAYETAEKGGLRSSIENAQTRIKHAVQRITKRSKVKREQEFEYERR
jgi:nitroreductase